MVVAPLVPLKGVREMNYADAVKLLKGKKARKIGHATVVHINEDNNIAIKYHATDIVTISQDDKITLNNNGWYTPTTKKNINKYTPINVRVYQSKYDWFVQIDKEVRPYKNGMTITENGFQPVFVA
jgi:hypothetical protein